MKNRFRTIVQFSFTIISNGYVQGFLGKGLYKGKLKEVCLPGLNCYSCPGALGSCPIGALQAVLASRNYGFSFYIAGFLLLVGALIGRLVCGFLCPFGLVQDLLDKIPLRKISKVPLDRVLRWLKYAVLALFVIYLPLAAVNFVGQGAPWFCKYICPSGTLMGGVPQLIMNEGLRASIGWLFGWKAFILISIIALSMIIYRPFCKYLCPLGAIYGATNKFSLYRYAVDDNKCTHCGACARVCKMNVDIVKSPNSPECIRCGDCKANCPTCAISSGFMQKKDSNPSSQQKIFSSGK